MAGAAAELTTVSPILPVYMLLSVTLSAATSIALTAVILRTTSTRLMRVVLISPAILISPIVYGLLMQFFFATFGPELGLSVALVLGLTAVALASLTAGSAFLVRASRRMRRHGGSQ